MIAEEEKKLAAGGDPEDWDSDENKAKYLKPVPKTQATTAMEKFIEKFLPDDAPGRKRKNNKMANLVEMMMKTDIEKKSPSAASTPSKGQSNKTIDTTDTVASVEQNAIVMIKDSYHKDSKPHEQSSVSEPKEITNIQVEQADDDKDSPDESKETPENGSAATNDRNSSRDSEHVVVHKTNSDFTPSEKDKTIQISSESNDNRLGKRSKSCVIL